MALSIRVGTVEEHIGRATSALVVESSACSSEYSLADACIQVYKKFVACRFIWSAICYSDRFGAGPFMEESHVDSFV